MVFGSVPRWPASGQEREIARCIRQSDAKRIGGFRRPSKLGEGGGQNRVGARKVRASQDGPTRCSLRQGIVTIQVVADGEVVQRPNGRLASRIQP